MVSHKVGVMSFFHQSDALQLSTQVFKILLTFENEQFVAVLKLKRIGHNVFLMRKAHYENMQERHVVVDEICNWSHHLRGSIRAANAWGARVRIPGGYGYVWMEEFIPYFTKFLAYPNNRNINKRLTISSSPRVQELQQVMLDQRCSPLIDAQGGFGERPYDGAVDRSVLILSDIETAQSLASKFGDIDEEECMSYILY